MSERYILFEPDVQRGLTDYVRQQFVHEDDVLAQVRVNTPAKGLPQIELMPEEGRMLQLLAALVGARRIVEIGTLAGYSGIWLARALPAGGKLITLELDPNHAAVAREHFTLAGVSDRVELIEGNAHENLKTLSARGPYDMVFIDAEKSGYTAYLAWAVDHVRSGGVIAAHNAFWNGALLDVGRKPRVAVMLDFLEALAAEDRLLSTIIPVGDGIAAAVVK